MHPPVRNQADIVNQSAYSEASGLDCSDLPDTTRQEFKREADVNWLLQRYGVSTNIPQRVVSFGEVDWDLDLHGAYIAMDSVGRAFQALPASLREKFPNQKALLDAMNTGELAKELAKLRDMAAAGDAPAPAEPSAPEGAE